MKGSEMRPKFFTKKQSELLSLIYPAPVGAGLSVAGAAKFLEISEQAAWSRIKNVKKRHPEAWKQVKRAMKINQRHKEQLREGAEYGNSLDHKYDVYGPEFDELIQEKF
jgi:hypothetical protein